MPTSSTHILLILLVLGPKVAECKDYTGSHVVRITAKIPHEVEEANKKLDDLTTPQYFPDVLIFSRFTKSETTAIVLVPEKIYGQVVNMLQNDFTFEILEPNVQKLLDEERAEMVKRRRKRSSTSGVPDPAHDYLSYREMNALIDQLTRTYNYTEKITIGRSFEGRNITMIRISEKSDWKKPKFLIEAGLHAREWLSHSTAINIAKELVTNPIYRYLRITLDIYVLPIANPDGYEYSRTADRLWRKNRRPFSVNCSGVDLNRNFKFKWDLAIATSDWPCSPRYRGPTAASELETQALSTWMEVNQPKGYLTMHTYGQYMAHPWGFARNTYTKDNNQMERIGIDAVNALEKVHGVNYSHGTSGNIVCTETHLLCAPPEGDIIWTLDPVSGGSDDFAKSVGVKYVYLMELRPAISQFGVNWKALFIQPVSEILPVAQETMAAAKVIADAIVHERYYSPLTPVPAA